MKIKSVVATTMLVVGILATLAMAVSFHIGPVYPGPILLAIDLAYLIFSITLVDSTKVPAEFEFGRSVGDAHAGVNFTPAGITEIRTLPAKMMEDELPADPEKIFRDEDKEKVPEGMFPPIRIKFGGPKPEGGPDSDDESLKNDPYNVAMVAEVVPVIVYQIESASDFFVTMKSIANFRKILGDKSVEVFLAEFSSITPARALRDIPGVSKKLKDTITQYLQDFYPRSGAKIRDAYVKGINFSHVLNAEVVATKVATQRAKVTNIDADAERSRMIKTGMAKKPADMDATLEPTPYAFAQLNADAIKKLSEVKGTLVLGGNAVPTINLNNPKE